AQRIVASLRAADAMVRVLLLERDDLFLETPYDEPLREFDQIDRDVRFRVSSDLHDLAHIAGGDEERLVRRIWKRSVVVQVDEGLHSLAPLIFRQPGSDDP